VDASGNVYVADSSNNKIRKINSAGVVTTLAGSGMVGSVDGFGTGIIASFYSPIGVAVDASGNVCVADYNNNKIRKINSRGVVTTLAGSGDAGSTDGAGTAASFYDPRGVAVDASGIVYVADQNNNKIRKINPAGVVTTLAGSGGTGSADGTGTAASFNAPTGVAADASGNVYVADYSNNKIRKINSAGVVTTLAGSGGLGSTDGTGTAASFYHPYGVAVDASGNVYVADEGNQKIRKIDSAGVVTTLAGSGNYGSTDGTSSAASFDNPSGVAVDASGNVYVADSGNNKIRKISSAGIVTTLAGGNGYGSTDGTGAAASFSNPSGVAVDASGNVYVADSWNNKIRKIVPPQKSVPVITWAAPADIPNGMALTAAQLNATANAVGTMVYTPAAGTVLNMGIQTLSVTFTPADTASFTTATATRTLTVIPTNNQAFLQKLFSSVLGRQIDPGGLAAFAAEMSGGRTRSAVYGDLIGSVEYNNQQIEPAIRLYYAALARPPDYAGLQNWSNALHAGALILTGAADQFASSTEFLLRYGNLNNTQYVQQLYRNVLGREADTAGLADWVGQLDHGASRGTVLVGFSESDEFKRNLSDQVEILRLYYLLLQRMPATAELQDWIGFLKGYDQTDTIVRQGCPLGLTNSAYVQAVFLGFLRRDADAGALSTFGDGLAAGTLTYGSLVETVMNSDEFNLVVAPVSRLYLAALRRVPDQPGLNNWVNYVRGGASLQVMADAFASSQEFINRYGAMNNRDYVAQLYRDVLGREADAAGLDHWTGLLDAGGTTRGGILIGFSESQEAIHLFAPTLRTFLHYFAFFNDAPTQEELEFWKDYLATLTDQFRQTFLDDPAFAGGG
jgi:sugar lactone lactonase YvrE